MLALTIPYNTAHSNETVLLKLYALLRVLTGVEPINTTIFALISTPTPGRQIRQPAYRIKLGKEDDSAVLVVDNHTVSALMWKSAITFRDHLSQYASLLAPPQIIIRLTKKLVSSWLQPAAFCFLLF